MKLAGKTCGGVLVKDYKTYKKWINKYPIHKNFDGSWELKFTTFQWLEFD